MVVMKRFARAETDDGGRIDPSTMILFSGSSILSGVIVIVCNFTILRWLPPNEMGIWQTALLVQTYATFVSLGILNGLGRELPFLLGSGDEKRAYGVANSAMTFAIGCGVALTLAGLGISLLWPGWQLSLRLAIFSNFLATGIAQYQGFLLGLYRSSNSFRKLAAIYLIGSFLQVFTLPLVVNYGLEGLCIRLLIITITPVIIQHIWRPIKTKLAFSIPDLMFLFRTGAPILFFSYVSTAIMALDRLFLANMATASVLGYYALAGYVYSGMAIIPSSLGHYIYPRMAFRLGKTSDPSHIWGLAWKSSTLNALLAVPVFLGGLVIIQIIVPLAAPQYIPGISIAMIACGAAWISTAVSGVDALNAMKAWKAQILLYILTALTFLMVWFLPFGLSILWRAGLAGAVMRVTYVLVGFLLSRSILKKQHNSIS